MRSFWILFISLVSSCSHAPKTQSATATRPQGADDKRFESVRPTHEATGKSFAVASQGVATSNAAKEMIDAGGNIIDAFAAASLAIGVERPHSTGLGGGGFLLYRDGKTKKVYAFDFREKAPLAAKKNMFLDAKGEVAANRSTDGVLAIGVPGEVAGVMAIHRRFGHLPISKVFGPAVRLADQGFKIYPELADAITGDSATLKKDPQALRLFFDSKGHPKKTGDLLVQKNLARALRLISSQGERAFYRGRIAKALVAQQKKLGGLITSQDLAKYQMKERQPAVGDFLDAKIYSMPPPSSGGTHVVQILKVIELLKLNRETPFSIENVNETAQDMQRTFYDRAQYLGDSDFLKVPVKGLTSAAYNLKIAEAILKHERATPPAEIKNGDPFSYESNQTTHFTMMNAQGDVATSTQTINGHFGSKVMVPDYGIFLNNEMDDFSAKPGALNMFGAVGSTANEVAPQKRPLSSMSPTIVEQGDTVIALGSPSGTRIISCVAQTIANRLYYGMPLYAAQSALRYHQQYSPDQIQVEAPGFGGDLKSGLEKLGHTVVEKDLGCRVQAVEKSATGLTAVSDPRGEGIALGF